MNRLEVAATSKTIPWRYEVMLDEALIGEASGQLSVQWLVNNGYLRELQVT